MVIMLYSAKDVGHGSFSFNYLGTGPSTELVPRPLSAAPVVELTKAVGMGKAVLTCVCFRAHVWVLRVFKPLHKLGSLFNEV